MNLLMISLSIPALISVVEIFLQKEKRKLHAILALLTIIGVVTTFFITKDDAKENEAMKQATKRTESLLKDAEVKITEQSKTLNEGFANLQAQISNAGIDNSVILAAVKGLETQVTQFTGDSKSFFTKAIESSKPIITEEEKAKGIVVNDSYVKIPVDERNSILFDTKNTLTVVNTEDDWVILRINGHDFRFVPGVQIFIETDKNTRRIFSYKGKENGRFVFYVHD